MMHARPATFPTDVSSLVSRGSAALLASAGLTMLFGADALLPRLAPGTPTSASWLGQWIAAGWLAVAQHNWTMRRSVIGGVHGRPTVMLNLMVYAVCALAAFKAPHAPPAVRASAIGFAMMVVVYAALMLRGPFPRRPLAPQPADAPGRETGT